MKVTILGDGFVRCHVYLMDLCLLIDKFGLFGLGKAAIYVSPSIEMDAWGEVRSHRPCGSPTLPEDFFACRLLIISHTWDHLTSGNQCKGCLQSTVLSLHLRSSPLSAVVLFLGCANGGVWCPWAVLARLLLPSAHHSTPLWQQRPPSILPVSPRQCSKSHHCSRCLCHYFQGLSLGKTMDGQCLH